MFDKLKIPFVYLIVISTYSIIFLDNSYIIWLCREDGPVENIGAVFFIIASGLFLSAYIYSSGVGNSLAFFHTHRNIFYLLLGVYSLICFGEEISWGQRIFNWETPKMLDEINLQGETNLHNIGLFQRTKIFNMTRLFSSFWLLFFVIVPLMDRVSLKTHIFFKHIGLPITPLWIGILFITNAAIIITINKLAYLPTDLYELKESNYAFVFVILAYHELRKNLMHLAPN